MSAEQTRDRILNAALKLFSQKGFLGATTLGIAREAGVAEVTLFRHFGSKEKLFEEVIRGYSFLPAMKGILPGLEQAGYEETLKTIARRFLGTLEERRDLIRIMLAERYFYTMQVKNIFRGMLGEVFGMLADYFQRLQRQGVLRDFDPDDAARAFLGVFFAYVHGLGFFFEETADSKRRECFAVEFVHLFVEGTIRQRPGDAQRKKPARRGNEVKAGSQPWTVRTR
jgi:AcrR family transcriptional regulator